jgi:hypothetical protein
VRLKARVDANQSEIDSALEAMGWLVVPTHQLGKGFPDRIGIKAGRVVFLEVKDGTKPPSRRKLTPDEVEKHRQFKAFGVHVHVIEKVEDLASIDRDARERHEPGCQPREYYKP